jgi:L-tyrosine isonitrile desaturase/decarboxylase
MSGAQTTLPAVGLRIDVGGEDDLLRLPAGYVRQRVLEHKLVVLRGFRALTADEFLAFARGFDPAGSRLLEWPTGPIMNVAIDPNAVSYLFSRERVPFHWDGHFDVEPSYLVFQCIQAPRRGGATLFVDAAKVWDLADDERRRTWEKIEVTYVTEKKAHYGGICTNPLVRKHPITQRMTLRYAEPVTTGQNRQSATFRGPSVDDPDAIIEDLRTRIYDPRVCYEHVWQDGDVAIADNQALLHGRTAIEDEGPRHLRRVQIL